MELIQIKITSVFFAQCLDPDHHRTAQVLVLL